jgi:hypothetical protein
MQNYSLFNHLLFLYVADLGVGARLLEISQCKFPSLQLGARHLLGLVSEQNAVVAKRVLEVLSQIASDVKTSETVRLQVVVFIGKLSGQATIPEVCNQ